MKNNKIKEFLRFLKYAVVAISAGVIQIVSFTLLNEVAKAPYWVSYLVSLILSVIWNFTINRKATFKTDTNYGIAMLEDLCYYAVFTPASLFAGDALVGIGWNEYLVEFLSMVVNMATEYVFMRLVIFRKKIDNLAKDNKKDSLDETETDNIDTVEGK